MRAFKTKRICRTRTIAVLGLTSLLLPAAALAANGDFNGDGFADLAIGVPNEGVGGAHGAGAVNVIYGSAGDGLDAADNQIWHQNVTGILDDTGFNDHFGWSLAVGDFNGDGFDDLAVGVPGEEVGGMLRAGAVNVIYGSATGLDAAGNQLWSQGSAGFLDSAETDDNFGWSLAAGDFNHDGYADLAVGVPGEDVSIVLDAGAVSVIYGTMAGLAATGNQLWNQDVPGVLDVAESGDEFGYSLAAGDYNGDLISDLAIGVWSEDLATGGGVPIVDAGAVNVLYSDWSGLIVEGNQLWHQDVRGLRDGVRGKAEAGDHFGTSLAAGDFNGDSYSDLAVGTPRDSVYRIDLAGAVNVIYGFHEGLELRGNQHWHQDRVGIIEFAQPEDGFGASVAAGDFDGDGYDDLAIGIPHETVRDRIGCGAVAVLYGEPDGGLVRNGNQFWHQGRNGVRERNELWDQFGAALATGDFDGDGRDDLAIGVFNESVGSVNGGGAVSVLYGRGAGLRELDNQLWTQNSRDIVNRAEHVDWFGFSVASH